MSCLTEFECAVYADGELPARDAQEIAQHLERCGTCRNLVSAARVESRVLVECFQSTDFIEFELEDEALSAPQAQSLGVVRFAAFVLAMSVLLRPVLKFLEELGVRERMNWFVVAAAYIAPVGIRFVESVLRNASWIALSAILFLAIVVFWRRAMLVSSILSVLALFTVFSSSSYALDVRSSDKPVTVPSGETIDDTLVAAGESVTVDGTVTGDLIAFARQVAIRGRVKGNVISFAQRVELEGTVEGSVFGFAQSVQTRGQVARNVYAFAQTANITRDSRIAENAAIFAAESTIEGTIGRDAYARAASIEVSAPARINGSFTARVGRPESVHIEPGAVIAGKTDIQSPRPAPSKYSRLSFYVWQTIWLTAAFLAGLLLFWIVPALSRLRPATVRDLLASAGVGFLALVGLPVVAIIAAVTLIGLPLGLIALACWLIAMYFAKIVVAGFLGRSLLEKNDTHASTALVLLAGLVPIFIAINLPYVGGLVNFLLIVLGLGMLVLRAFQTTGWRSIQAA
jgi:cytoskeletal protein CcmA (bactofilin family)/predicted anti-sigma-YlaC factor YlaD